MSGFGSKGFGFSSANEQQPPAPPSSSLKQPPTPPNKGFGSKGFGFSKTTTMEKVTNSITAASEAQLNQLPLPTKEETGFGNKGFGFNSSNPAPAAPTAKTPKLQQTPSMAASFTSHQDPHQPAAATVEEDQPPPQQQLVLDHDIANGVTIPELEEKSDFFKNAKQSAAIVTLRLTNDKGLETMPCICKLPRFVHHIRFDASCSTITALEEGTSVLGFLCDSAGLEEVDLRVMNRLRAFASNFMARCVNLIRVKYPFAEPVSSGGTPRVSVGSGFLWGCTAMREVDLKYFVSLEAIPDSFLRCVRMTELDLRQFTRLKSIGNHFLAQCFALHSLHLPENTTFTIGSQFLLSCEQLTSVDLNFFRNNGQDVVPEEFLSCCRSLLHVDVEPLRNAHTLSNSFLSQCSKVGALDLSSFSRLHNLGARFLADCESLSSVKFPIVNANGTMPTSVGSCFLDRCRSLQTVDLSIFAGITTIPNGFLSNCGNLIDVQLKPLEAATKIGDSFLLGASSLLHIELPFATLCDIGNYFLTGCVQLESVGIPPSLHDGKTIVQIGTCFMMDCRSLAHLDLTFLSNLTSVPASFLHGTSYLTELDFSPLANVTSIGRQCLSFSGLKSVDFSGFTNVSKVGDRFFCDCSALENVRNMAALNLTEIGMEFMSGCESLTTADISGCCHLTRVGGRFMKSCPALRLLRCPLPKDDQKNLSVGPGFLKDCPALEYIDLRFMGNEVLCEQDPFHPNAENGAWMLHGCRASVLCTIVTLPSATARLDNDSTPVSSALPFALRKNILEVERRDCAPHLQWSWTQHRRHPKGVQLAALWMFNGLQYAHTTSSAQKESRKVPGDVAFEICQYIGTPFTELLPGPAAFPGFGPNKKLPSLGLFAKKDATSSTETKGFGSKNGGFGSGNASRKGFGSGGFKFGQ